MLERDILVSVVSHGHHRWLEPLLSDLTLPGNAERIRVVLTLNIPEVLKFSEKDFSFPLHVRHNPAPMGFARNNNLAFKQAVHRKDTRFFCVLNPDMRLPKGAMARLSEYFEEHSHVALVAPTVLSGDGMPEDNVRPLPTPSEILSKACSRLRGRSVAPTSAPHMGPSVISGSTSKTILPNWFWVAGMFMLFDMEAYKAVDGFDERYFLYYEDVDICCRLGLAGYTIHHCPEVKVTHHAQRHSHYRWNYLLHHIRSALQFYTSPTYRQSRKNFIGIRQ